MHKLKVGIAGFGVVGKRRMNCINKHPNFEVTAVCDQAFKGDGVLDSGVIFCQNYQKLIQEELDALFVCMTNDVSAEVTIAGLNRGLHVFCEKPPGRNVADIERVIISENLNPSLKLMYGFNHRYHDSVQQALKIIRSGELGDIINMRGVYGKAKLVTFDQPDWRTQRKISGGGILLDQGIHMVDLMRLFGGEFEEVYSFIKNSHWGYDVEDNAYAIMKTSKGIVGMLNSSATQWRHRFNLDINLTCGSLILGGILSGTKSYGAETLTVIKADPDNDGGSPREDIIHYDNDPSWDSEVNTFSDYIVNDTLVRNSSSKEALKTMQLVYKIYYADPDWRNTYDIPNPN